MTIFVMLIQMVAYLIDVFDFFEIVLDYFAFEVKSKESDDAAL